MADEGENFKESTALRSPLIMEVTNLCDIDAIGKFRYNQYIIEHERPYIADHENKLFVDNVDPVSRHFIAKHNDELCCALRLTRAIDAVQDEQFESLIEACSVPPCKMPSTVINSRFATQPRLVAKRQITPLFQYVYAAGLKMGAELCLLSTRAELVSLFERFGFIANRAYHDPIVGERLAMSLDAYDFVHLERINSPYLAVARAVLSEDILVYADNEKQTNCKLSTPVQNSLG